MGKLNPIQTNLTAGEITPRALGRVDLKRYVNACKYFLNFIPQPQGGACRRSGTRFVNEVKDSTKKVRLLEFEFSTTQAYILEIGNMYIRFYRNEGQIISAKNVTGAADNGGGLIRITATAHGFQTGNTVTVASVGGVPAATGTWVITVIDANNFDLIGSTFAGLYTSGGTATAIVEVSTTYTESELFDLQFTQSADTLYIVHPSHAPAKLTRSSNTAWTLADIAFIDGPYLDQNKTTTTIAASGTTGSVTLTASAALFSANDIGRWVRKKDSSTWGAAKITAFTNTTTVTAAIHADFPLGAGTAVTTWRLGAWYIGNYPSCVSFFEERLTFANTPLQPQTVWMSVSGDYETFSPTTAAALVLDSSAITYTISSNKVNSIIWLSAGNVLLMGTVGGEWRVGFRSASQPLTPTNISVTQQTSYGSRKVRPRAVGGSVLFVQRSGRRLRELVYDFQSDGFLAEDVSILGEHLLREGDYIVDAAFHQEPYSSWFGIRNDGVVVGMTYLKEQEVSGWHRHILGGAFTGASNAIVESMAVIPSPDTTEDQSWFSVKRTINGSTKRYIEFLENEFQPTDELDKDDAFFVDCGLTLDNPKTITGATKANPVVVTAASHGFSNGDVVRIKGVLGMTELNYISYKVANVATNTFELTNASTGVNVNGTAYTTYISAGTVRKKVTAIPGLSHLEGQTVQVLCDGATQPDKIVVSGSITLDRAASVVQAGLPFPSILTTLAIEGGGDFGTAQGKIKRTDHVSVRFLETLGLKYQTGEDYDDLTELPFRNTNDPMNASPPLYTGDKRIRLEQGYVTDGIFTLVQDDPLPMTILAIMPETEVDQ